MQQHTNEHGQPIGPAVPHWTPPPWPPLEPLVGRRVSLVPLATLGARELAEATAGLFAGFDPSGASWTYLPYGPFADTAAFGAWLDAQAEAEDPQLFLIRQLDGSPVGLAAYLRIVPATGSIEVGHVHFTTALQRTAAATEAMALMMARAFELGFRRYEWKCDALNEPSRRAALRLGFREEGTFRCHTVYKGRSRDTTWFSITAEEWPSVRAVLEAWLEPANFGPQGQQLSPLGGTDRPSPGARDGL